MSKFLKCRRLRKVLRLSDNKTFFADGFALWEDLGNGYLQPTVSMKGNPMFLMTMKINTGYNGFVFVSDQEFFLDTSMNNLKIIRQSMTFGKIHT